MHTLRTRPDTLRNVCMGRRRSSRPVSWDRQANALSAGNSYLTARRILRGNLPNQVQLARAAIPDKCTPQLQLLARKLPTSTPQPHSCNNVDCCSMLWRSMEVLQRCFVAILECSCESGGHAL
eukprot:jgi/Ulvmu1/4550/UM002_0276.1